MPPHPPEASGGGPVSRRDGTPVVLLLGGDGIGPEVVEAAAACMQAAARRLGRAIRLEEAPIGGAALEMGLPPLPEPTLRMALDADAVLLGAVGGPRWDGLPGPQRPEAGLLELRRQLGVFANVRPVRMFAGLETTSPLRPEVVAGTDLVVVRERLGGLYYGPRGRRQGPGGPVVFDTLEYDQAQIDRAARCALEMARRRRRSLTLVDKANVLESSRMWRERVQALAPAYPDVAVSFQYVDSCAMRLVREPRAFDVLLCENMFGDILSDEAAVLAGSIGMLPSASLGGRVGLYEPVHGSAPDIAGRGVANPIGAILAGAMLLEWSLGWRDAAACIEAAVARVLAAGWRTGDLVPAGGPAPGVSVVGTQALTDRILAAIEQSTPQEGSSAPS
ncbi:MAG: 3-isopropylmalate dehydrogenase [Firmicutes bacterium]|nr:3-isopropylmalate dehydrogenase [Bacillota bacterium]